MLVYTTFGIVITLVTLALAFTVRYTPYFAGHPTDANVRPIASKMYLMLGGNWGCKLISGILFFGAGVFVVLYSLSWRFQAAKSWGELMLILLMFMILGVINTITYPWNKASKTVSKS